jgi:bifunctional UDP-N-acetylglucosamine pyrophosphorylase/glucosamine-1-phosphate N-acetyltransferase
MRFQPAGVREPERYKVGKRQSSAVVMAAGESKRMKSAKTKVLHRIAGKPVLYYTLEAIREAGTDRIVVVVGRQAEEVRMSFEGGGVEFMTQEEQLGTGHAAHVGLKPLVEFEGDVLVLCGDVPLVRKETLADLMKLHREKNSKVTLLTTNLNDPKGYGRIVRDDKGLIIKIVEEKEADSEEKKIKEINSGIMCFDRSRRSRRFRTPDRG